MFEKVWRTLHSLGRDWRSIEQPTIKEDDIKEPLTPIHLYCSHRILNSIKGEGHESDSHCSNNRGQALSGKHHWIKYTNLSGSVGEKIIY